jgi:MFS family permease
MTQPSATLGTQARFAIAAAIGCIMAVGVGLSLTIPLLSVRLEAMGLSKTVIGMHVAAMAISNLALAPLVPGLAARLGLKRLLASAAGLGVIAILGFAVIVDPVVWFGLRIVLAASLVTLFTASEFWINAIAPPARRGLILGIYATVLALGFAAGPAILAAVGTQGHTPFLVGALCFAIATLPLLFAGSAAPSLSHGSGRGVLSFLFAAPAATLAGLVFGAVETGAFSFLPLFGLRTGYTETEAALLLTIAGIGNVVFQIPIGIWADRAEKRLVLIACAGVGVAGSLAIAVVATHWWALAAVLFVWGGVISALYTVGLAHLGARFTGADLAAANAAFVMLYSTGMLIGPLAIGGAMDIAGPSGLPVTMAAFFAFYVGVVAARLVQERHGRVPRP